MNFIYKKRSMLNFKESVAKVKSAPNFGKMTTIGILSSLGIFSTFFFFLFANFDAVPESIYQPERGNCYVPSFKRVF